VRVDMVAVRGALRRMAIVTSDLTHRIKMEMGYQPDMMRISVETPDVGTASEEVPVTYEGEPLAIGFNVQYLLEFLRYTPPGEVRMTFKGPEGAAILEPMDDDSGATTQMLVMPLRLLS
jgi:DNA polymerase-3 subunit beta